MIDSVTDPAAHCRNEVELFRDGAGRGWSRLDDAVIEKIRE